MTIALILTAMLLLVGMSLRLAIPLFRWLYIPGSVIAGALGLVVVQLFASRDDAIGDDAPGRLVAESAAHWESWPGVLIAVVFAGMLLDRPSASLGNSLRRAGREGLMVWVIVLGQTAMGLLATWLVIAPWFDVPDAFGMLIETGFAGGHGTAAAMGQVFATPEIQLVSGLDLGVTMATIGLVYGILSGVFWINIGVRRGWTGREKVDSIIDDQHRQSLGTAVVRGDVIDPLLVQAIWLALAFGIGMGLQWLVNTAAVELAPPPPADATDAADELTERSGIAAVIGSFPLFIYTLFGGWILRRLLSVFQKSDLIDPVSIHRLSATAMDVLVVAAIGSLNPTAVIENAGSIAILVAVAAVWTSVCLVVLSPRMLPHDHWFELGLINYGMSTGTTATGFVLLRMIDPELESGAAEDYALAAPLSSPFVGGGMLTVGIPLLVLGRVPLPVVVFALIGLIAFLIVIGIWVARTNGESVAPSPADDRHRPADD